MDGWREGLQYAAPAPQVALGLVLLVSGIGNARDRHALVAGALNDRALTPGVVRPAAALLPFVELILGAALLLRVWFRPTAWLAADVFAVFAVAVAINVRRGRAIPCHCFGASAADRIGPLSLTRLLVIILLALTVARADTSNGSRSMLSGQPDRTLSLASIAVATVWMILMVGPMQVLLGNVPAVSAGSQLHKQHKGPPPASAKATTTVGQPTSPVAAGEEPGTDHE